MKRALICLLAACGPTPPDDPGAPTASSTGLEDPSTSTSLPTTSGDTSTSSGAGEDPSSSGGSSSSESTGGVPNNFCTLCDIFGDCFAPNVCTLDVGIGLHICATPCERGDTCEGMEALCAENLDGVGFSCQQGEGGELLCLPARVS